MKRAERFKEKKLRLRRDLERLGVVWDEEERLAETPATPRRNPGAGEMERKRGRSRTASSTMESPKKQRTALPAVTPASTVISGGTSGDKKPFDVKEDSMGKAAKPCDGCRLTPDACYV